MKLFAKSEEKLDKRQPIVCVRKFFIPLIAKSECVCVNKANFSQDLLHFMELGVIIS